jgi:hypothetical protein
MIFVLILCIHKSYFHGHNICSIKHWGQSHALNSAHPTEAYTTHHEIVLTLTHILSIFHITSVNPSDSLSPIMSRTSNVDQEKAKKAVSILLWALRPINALYYDAGDDKRVRRGAIMGSKINYQLINYHQGQQWHH